MTDRLPLGTPGRIAEVPETDTLLAGSIRRTIAGDLTFEDPVTGIKSLAQLAAGGGGIGGSTGVDDKALLRANGTGGATVQAGAPATLEDDGTITAPRILAGGTPPDGVAVVAIGGALGASSGLHISGVAAAPNISAVNIVGDAAGFSGVRALNVSYTTGASASTSHQTAIAVSVDDTLSGGGGVSGLEVSSTGNHPTVAVLAGPRVAPLTQSSGAYTDSPEVLVLAVNQTVALSTGGAGNISMFVANGGTVTVAGAAKFAAISVVLDQFAGQNGILPIFEYSTGVGTWATFGATDGTNGMRQSGAITWTPTDIPLWVIGTGGRFLVRITRTNGVGAASGTRCDAIRISATDSFYWDKDGNLRINSAEFKPVAVNPGSTPADTLWIDSASVRAKQGSNTLAYLSEIAQPIVISPPAIAAQANNYSPTGWSTSTNVRIALTGAQSITGFDATASVATKTVSNTDASVSLTLPHLSGSSSAANQILCPNGVSLVVPALSSVEVWYDPTTTKWRPIALPAGGSGEVNTASNLGSSGTGLFAAKAGVDLQFFKIDCTNGLNKSVIANVLTIDAVLLLPRDGSRPMTAALDMAAQPQTALGYRIISDTIAATANNYNPASLGTADEIRITLTGNQSLTGMTAPVAGGTTRKTIYNIDTVDTLSIPNEGATSTAANRFLTPNATTLDIQPQGGCLVEYDATSSRWRFIGVSRSILALPAAGAVLSAVRRSTGSLNIAAATFIGFDSTLHTTDTVYWTFSGTGTWTCQRAHEAFFDWQLSFVNGSDVNAQVDGECRVSTDGGSTFVTVVQANAGSAYSTTNLKDMISGRSYRNWAVGEQVRFYVVPTLGNFTTIALRTCAQIVWISG